MKKNRTAILLASMTLLTTSAALGRDLPSPVWGVTLDSVSKLPNIVSSLENLNKMPTARIVFDEWVAATEYDQAVNNIRPASYIMGELLDSFYVKKYSLSQYQKRAQEYVDFFGDRIDLYEIGNEVNGEWLGGAKSVIAKVQSAYDIVHGAGYPTALTLYYNEGCWEKSANEMFRWAEKNISQEMKENLDYVWVSYYEDDCNNLQPDWPDVFERLGEMFPHSKIGFGEVGTKKKARKAEYIERYYRMKINHPRYVGGYFWWYFKQDAVPLTKPLWGVINSAWMP